MRLYDDASPIPPSLAPLISQPVRFAMNVPPEMTPVEIGRTQLDVLRRLHRELDEEIGAITAGGVVCSLTLGRMKREKLALKDRIARIEDAITPDIIA